MSVGAGSIVPSMPMLRVAQSVDVMERFFKSRRFSGG